MNNVALKEGELVAKESMIHLIILGLVKTSAGLLTGMTVILADAIATFADVLGVFASYLGLRLSRKSEDDKFAYGYYKIETFAALIVSFGTIYAGYVIMSKAIANSGMQVEGQYRPFAITATIIAIIHSYKLGKKLENAGKRVNSLSLIANAKDKKMDMFAGVIILVSIIANYRQIPYVETSVTIIIALIILRVGILSAKESLFFLLDYWNDPRLLRKIKRVFKKEHDLVPKINKIRLRRAGTFIFGEAFVEINPYAGIEDLREELELLKSKIMSLDPYIKDFPIYTHISKRSNVKVAVAIVKGRSLNSEIAPNLKKTKAYLFAEIRKGKIKNTYVKKLEEKQKTSVELAAFLKKEKVNIVINNQLNSLIYYYLRRTNHILIYPNFSNLNTAKDTLELLIIDT